MYLSLYGVTSSHITEINFKVYKNISENYFEVKNIDNNISIFMKYIQNTLVIFINI